ncbi:glycine betaine/L-proline ABC transporter ATP-binding protein [Promicromonospora citrea]|uniref:Glycine/betaine ABC transporter ATP-binding protein n=1 Tax=Promicromonospora citrea TaxID=43677 RepID=A0A8H9L6Q9_9MICO|nr:glycine betaine/L-proline ABC transporter ATP-binding protein [Promicromonospora citrea]NNH52379.1 glycine betaine/L-proline ABC transporter ATP-binding protein [Promicromonospora citrea]GGM36820.1 glycine/betaine ABC transporter ATP-binding protein [Promicromonospora citrea]
MPAIEAHHLYKVFGRKGREGVRRLEAGADAEELRKAGLTPAVVDASFTVDEGEIFVVMGLSGSGKSTLIRMINGLHPPTSGHVELYGENITAATGKDLRRLRRERISMVFQHFALFPHRTVLDNAAYGLEAQGVGKEERRARAHEALELCGLTGWDDHLPGELSGGMQQRVGLARALAADTDILLMDEAFSALDPLIRRDMQDQLVELQQKLGKTILFITHDLNEAMRIGDRIAMMRNGRIVQVGTAEEILTDPANDYVAQFVADVDRTRVLTASSVMEPPAATLKAEQGPRAAHKVMREHQVPALFVTGRDRTLRGYVTEDEVGRNLDRTDITTLLHPVPEAARVAPDTALADLFGPAAETPAVAVVDDDGRLLGVVPRITLLAALSQDGTSQDGTSQDEPSRNETEAARA